MEIADVRKRVLLTIDRAKREAAARRAAADRTGAAYHAFLEHTAVPLMRQLANVLRAEGYVFSVFTPLASVRLMSDRTAEDFIEIALDSTGDEPRVVGHTSRGRGRRVVEAERVIGSGDPAAISEEELLAFLLKALEPLVER